MRGWTPRRLLALCLVALLPLSLAAPARAGDIERRGDAYIIYLPEDLDFHEVVDRLKTEILAINWSITDVQDIDVGLRQYHKITQNKVISVCKSQLLVEALAESPYISLIIPCRFTAFRDVISDSQDYSAVDGRIVVGFYDPVAEAKALGIARYQAAQQATDELKAVLQTLADFYAE
jgi:uncharacterized protein (DUF302 family)